MTAVGADFILTERDREIYERELASFVPDRVFDAHSHFIHPDFFWLDVNGIDGPVGWEQFAHLQQLLYPARQLGALFLAYSTPDKPSALSNQYTADEIRQSRYARGAMFVAPGDDPAFVHDEVKRLGATGFKVYHDRAPQADGWNAEIPQYMPEWLAGIADELALCVTLHIVRSRALADPSNIHWIRRYCTAYPNMKLILAHSSRGFQPSHNLEGLPQLTDIENLYFDCSANCESIAHQSIIRLMGHERLMWGSDFPISHRRGRSVGVADGFLWLNRETLVGERTGGVRVDPTLVGIENLRSLKHACWSEGLTDSHIEDIFWNNAAALFNLD